MALQSISDTMNKYVFQFYSGQGLMPGFHHQYCQRFQNNDKISYRTDYLPVHFVDYSSVENNHQSKWHIGIDNCIQVPVCTVVFRIQKVTLRVRHLNSEKPLSFKNDKDDDYGSAGNLSCFDFAHDVGFQRKIHLEAPTI